MDTNVSASSYELDAAMATEREQISKSKGNSLALVQRVVSASFGAVLTSLLVTPLDVVKTRLQAQQHLCLDSVHSRDPLQCKRCTHYNFHNGLMDVMLPKSFLHHSAKDCPHNITGTFDGLMKISRHQGIAALYNGLRPTLVMAVPSTVLYFASYDKFKEECVRRFGFGSALSSLLSGISARTLSAIVISPLELVRTKMMAAVHPPSMMKLGLDQVRSEGLLSLWTGLSPTLFRDVPFSGIYWVVADESRARVGRWVLSKTEASRSAPEEFFVSFASGASGGFVAALLTHPFDVIKTRRQIYTYSLDSPKAVQIENSSCDIARRILKQEGFAGFLVGLAPRLGKIIPACAIMLSSYEAGKKLFDRI